LKLQYPKTTERRLTGRRFRNLPVTNQIERAETPKNPPPTNPKTQCLVGRFKDCYWTQNKILKSQVLQRSFGRKEPEVQRGTKEKKSQWARGKRRPRDIRPLSKHTAAGFLYWQGKPWQRPLSSTNSLPGRRGEKPAGEKKRGVGQVERRSVRAELDAVMAQETILRNPDEKHPVFGGGLSTGRRALKKKEEERRKKEKKETTRRKGNLGCGGSECALIKPRSSILIFPNGGLLCSLQASSIGLIKGGGNGCWKNFGCC